MSTVTHVKSSILHGIAKIDAGESVPHYAPLQNKVLPVASLGLGLAAMGHNYRHAADADAKHKVLVRDGLVISGITATSLAASYLVNRKGVAQKIAKQMNEASQKLSQAWQKNSQKAKPSGHHHHHGCSHHDHSHHHLEAFPKSPKKLLASLFQADKHSHGGEAAVALTLLSAIPIFLGGIPAGVFGDWLNKENWRETLPMKLKEGTFQFLGNITVCTVSILGFSALAKGAAKQLWKSESVRNGMKKNTQAYLEQLVKSPKENLELIPTKLTEDVETILLKHRNEPGKYAQAFRNHFQQFGAEWDEVYTKELASLLEKGPIDHAAVHAKIRGFMEPKLRDAIQGGLKQADQIDSLAHLRFNSRAENIGVIGGVLSGVVGGAWLSNQVNEAAAKAFNWPKGHVTSGLFQRSHHAGKHSDSTDRGWLAGTVGDRGIHWYDGILHLDDIPSALYLGGMKSIESMIQLLYGVSGFLAGTAGIDYSQPKRKKAPTQQSPCYYYPPQPIRYSGYSAPTNTHRTYYG